MSMDMTHSESSCFMDHTYVVFSFETLEFLLFRLDLLRKRGDHLLYSIAIRLQCWNNVLDSTFDKHAADQTKTFAIRLLL